MSLTTNDLDAIDAAAVQWGRSVMRRVLWRKYLAATDATRLQNPEDEAARAAYRAAREQEAESEILVQREVATFSWLAEDISEHVTPLDPTYFDPATRV